MGRAILLKTQFGFAQAILGVTAMAKYPLLKLDSGIMGTCEPWPKYKTMEIVWPNQWTAWKAFYKVSSKSNLGVECTKKKEMVNSA